MPKLTVLHVSDLHWSPTNSQNVKTVLDALFADVQSRREEDNLSADLVVFTGDLVMAGESDEHFSMVKSVFVDPLLHAANVPTSRFFIVPGNHDISRSMVRQNGYLESGLKNNLCTVDSTNKFIDGVQSGNPVDAVALNRLDAFSQFVTTLGQIDAITTNPLLRTFNTVIGGHSVGIACFNTAWRATGESDHADRNFLLLGERNVDVAINDLADCQTRLALFHHPLEWLAEFDEIAVSSRLYSHFDVLFYGHSHRSSPELRVTSLGTAVLSQTGCLYEKREFFNGYQYLVIDTDTSEVEIIARTYQNTPRRSFDKAVNVAPEGRIRLSYVPREPGQFSASIEKFLREVRPVIRENAADHISIAEASDNIRLDAKEAFVCPPLTMTRVQAAENRGDDEEAVLVEDVLRSADNFLMIGPRESGKTSLAHYMAVLSAEGISDKTRIPVVVDARSLKINAYGLKRAIGSYFGATKVGLDLDSACKNGEILILLDNFSQLNEKARNELTSLIDQFPLIKWIIYSNRSSAKENGEDDEDDSKRPYFKDFRAAYIQTLPRRSIRELSRRWCEQTGSDDEKTYTAVMAQLRSSNLPRTGYIVTLLLWAVYQEKRFERINEAVLLSNMSDYLLGRADFTQSMRREFDPTSKEITLQALSKSLRDKGGFSSVGDSVQFLEEFFARKKLPYDASDILNKLVQCGLLRQSDGYISFKYQCFQEYFYAGLLRENPELLSECLSEESYLLYTREIDLLSGLRRQNADIIAAIQHDIQSKAPPELSDYPLSRFDVLAAEQTAENVSRKKLQDIRKRKLTSLQIDDLLDATERRLARASEEDDDEIDESEDDAKAESPDAAQEAAPPATHAPAMTPGNFMSAVALLGRVVRNSEFTDGIIKVSATKVYLENTIKVFLLFAFMTREVIAAATESPGKHGLILDAEESGTAVYMLTKMWFNLTSSAILDEIGTLKLMPIYEEIVSEEGTSLAIKIMLIELMLELGAGNWPQAWISTIDENKKNRFVLDAMVDTIWGVVHTRAMSESERKRVEKVVEHLEITMGMPKHQKSAMLGSLRSSASDAVKADSMKP